MLTHSLVLPGDFYSSYDFGIWLVKNPSMIIDLIWEITESLRWGEVRMVEVGVKKEHLVSSKAMIPELWELIWCPNQCMLVFI